jgi:sulfate adenylyltransferase (ADP) / ATP adenylyltransferase
VKPVPEQALQLQPGTLWPSILRQTAHALHCGALRPIETVNESIEDSGVRFLVRRVSSLARKDEEGKERTDKAEQRAEVNPFLPYDRDLFVADLSDTHIALLNKFSVIDHHLLIVTRRVEEQEALLTLADFVALFACMAEFGGLAFYNGGAGAGASQRHKHLQIVPLPLGTSGPAVPIEPLLTCARIEDAIGTVPGLPFLHAFARLNSAAASRPLQAGKTAFEHYRALLGAGGLRAVDVDGKPHQSAPYNLLVTREWMLLVPRSAELVAGISVNALGFAGSLFARDEEQIRTIKALGPMTALRRTAVAAT